MNIISYKELTVLHTNLFIQSPMIITGEELSGYIDLLRLMAYMENI